MERPAGKIRLSLLPQSSRSKCIPRSTRPVRKLEQGNRMCTDSPNGWNETCHGAQCHSIDPPFKITEIKIQKISSCPSWFVVSLVTFSANVVTANTVYTSRQRTSRLRIRDSLLLFLLKIKRKQKQDHPQEAVRHCL